MGNNLRWNNYALDGKFLQLPNLLIMHHEEIGIDEKELMFLIKLSAHKDSFKLHDDRVVSGGQKTAQRRRKSLKEKGLLDFRQSKTISSDGEYRSEGFTYDLSKLNTKLQELYNNMSEEETIMSEAEDIIGPEERPQRPPNYTNYYTNNNTSSSSSKTKTTTTARKTSHNLSEPLYIEAENNIQTFIPSSETYCLTPKDKKIIESNPQVVESIIHWKDYAYTYMKDVNGNKLFRKKDIFDKYQLNSTSLLHVIEQHWNNFSKTF